MQQSDNQHSQWLSQLVYFFSPLVASKAAGEDPVDVCFEQGKRSLVLTAKGRSLSNDEIIFLKQEQPQLILTASRDPENFLAIEAAESIHIIGAQSGGEPYSILLGAPLETAVDPIPMGCQMKIYFGSKPKPSSEELSKIVEQTFRQFAEKAKEERESSFEECHNRLQTLKAERQLTQAKRIESTLAKFDREVLSFLVRSTAFYSEDTEFIAKRKLMLAFVKNCNIAEIVKRLGLISASKLGMRWALFQDAKNAMLAEKFPNRVAIAELEQAASSLFELPVEIDSHEEAYLKLMTLRAEHKNAEADSFEAALSEEALEFLRSETLYYARKPYLSRGLFARTHSLEVMKEQELENSSQEGGSSTMSTSDDEEEQIQESQDTSRALDTLMELVKDKARNDQAVELENCLAKSGSQDQEVLMECSMYYELQPGYIEDLATLSQMCDEGSLPEVISHLKSLGKKQLGLATALFNSLKIQDIKWEAKKKLEKEVGSFLEARLAM